MSRRPAHPRRYGADARGGAVRRRRPVLPDAVAAAAAVALSLRRARLGALRGHLPPAVVPDHAGRAAAARAPRRATVCRQLHAALDAIVELGPGSGEKLATLAGQRAPELAEPLHGAPRRRLGQRRSTRRRSAIARRRDACASSTHHATYEVGLRSDARERRRRDGRTLVLFLGSNIGNFDPPGASALLRGIRARSAPGRRAAARRRSRQAGARAAARLRRSARRDRRVQPQSARARSTASSAATSTSTAFAHRAVWNAGGVAHRDAPGRAVAAADAHRGGTGGVHDGGRARGSGRRAPTSIIRDDIRRLAEPAGFRVAAQWIDREDGFALTLLEAV